MSEKANAPKVEETPKAQEQTPKAKTPKAKAVKGEKPKKDWKERYGKLETVLNRG